MVRTDLAHLVAGVVLALAGCALALSHVAIPSFLPFAALTLLGVGAGLSLPGASSRASLRDSGNDTRPAGHDDVPAALPLPPAAPPAASGSAAAS